MGLGMGVERRGVSRFHVVDLQFQVRYLREVPDLYPGVSAGLGAMSSRRLTFVVASAWLTDRNHPDRLPATYKRTHGIRYFHGCYDLLKDKLWGIVRRRNGGDHTLAALKTIRAARPDGAPIYVILDNLSANKTPAIGRWAIQHKVELCLTPTSASWADPIEAQFGPLRAFTMANSDYPHHVVLAGDLQTYLRWRNANARHLAVIAAQRRERTRVRGERHQRWGRPPAQAT